MTEWFADTFFFLALLGARDSAHAGAVAMLPRAPGPVVTTEWVLTELGDAYAETTS